MTTLTVIDAPAVGARCRKRSTGRTWHVDRISGSGLVVLTEQFYGAERERRSYMTGDELAADYVPALS